jgi:hypothetical protein
MQNLLDDLKELLRQDDRLMVEGSLLKRQNRNWPSSWTEI